MHNQTTDKSANLAVNTHQSSIASVTTSCQVQVSSGSYKTEKLKIRWLTSAKHYPCLHQGQQKGSLPFNRNIITYSFMNLHSQFSFFFFFLQELNHTLQNRARVHENTFKA